MNEGMSEPKTWSRDELVAILGQPDSEKTQISQSEDLPDGQYITSVEVDKDTIGATRVIHWWCSPIPDDAEDINRAFKTLREQPSPDLNDAYAVVARATEVLDIMADSCVATSVVTGNEDDRWEIWRACSKHRQAGLKGLHDDPPPDAT